MPQNSRFNVDDSNLRCKDRVYRSWMLAAVVLCTCSTASARFLEFNPGGGGVRHKFGGEGPNTGPYTEAGYRFEEESAGEGSGTVAFGALELNDWGPIIEGGIFNGTVVKMTRPDGVPFYPYSLDAILSPTEAATIKLLSSKGGVRTIRSDQTVNLLGPLWEDIEYLEIIGEGCDLCPNLYPAAEGLIENLGVTTRSFVQAGFSAELFHGDVSAYKLPLQVETFEVPENVADGQNAVFTAQSSVFVNELNDLQFSVLGEAGARYSGGLWNLKGKYDVILNTNEPLAVLETGLFSRVSDKFSLVGEASGQVPVGPMLLSGEVDFTALGSLTEQLQSVVINGSIKSELGDYSFELEVSSETGAQGEFSVPRTQRFTLPIPANVAGGQLDITLEADVVGQTINQGLMTYTMDFSRTVTFDSLTFSDGTTPESLGLEVVMASGFRSPNLVPEPSSSFAVICSLACLLYRRTRRS